MTENPDKPNMPRPVRIWGIGLAAGAIILTVLGFIIVQFNTHT